MKVQTVLDLFDELKARIPITDVFNLYGVPVGRHNKCLCPFHNESTSSLTVYPDTNSFYCFGCGTGGSVIDFVQTMFGLEALDAAKKLDTDFGLNLSGRELTPEEKARYAAAKAEREERAAITAEYKSWENTYYIHLCESIRLYEDLRDLCSPTSPDASINDYVEALNKIQKLEYHIDILTNGTQKDKVDLYMAVVGR